MKTPQDALSDRELDRLLSAASNPPAFNDVSRHIATRITAPVEARVVPFPRSHLSAETGHQDKRRFTWAAGALAASLLLGLGFGTTSFGTLMEGATGTTITDQIAEFAPSGLDDLDHMDGDIES